MMVDTPTIFKRCPTCGVLVPVATGALLVEHPDRAAEALCCYLRTFPGFDTMPDAAVLTVAETGLRAAAGASVAPVEVPIPVSFDADLNPVYR